jgi:mono/diheme cytochrome c family protein
MGIASKSSGGSRSTLLVFLSVGLVTANGCLSPDGHVSPDNSYNDVLGPTDGGQNGGGMFGGGLDQPFIQFDGAPGDIGMCPPQAPVPGFGTPVTCGMPTPPISGGTLLVTHDGSRAIASDPDRNAVYVVDLGSKALKFTVALQPGDEPGRVAEDGAGRIHVALRGSGTLATIDPASGTIISRRTACPAPRGVAWQASNDVVWVACATGELASLPAAGGAASVKVIGRDLRDVIVDGDNVAVTLFRSAQLLRLAADGTVSRTDAMPSPNFLGPAASHVAWRAVPGSGGTVVAVHQAESTQSVSTKASGGYGCGGMGGPVPPVPLLLPQAPVVVGDAGVDDSSVGPVSLPTNPGPPGGLGGPVSSVVTVLASDGTVSMNNAFRGVLPVDVAVSSDGTTVAAVAAGSGTGGAAMDNLYVFESTTTSTSERENMIAGQTTAVAYEPNGELLVQTREPAAIWIVPSFAAVSGAVDAWASSIPLSTVSVQDTGNDIFHTHAGALIACASCHPEGGDDGHVWLLDGNKRRTPSLRGTIAGTAPYHWPGDEADFAAIVKNVYVQRMSGAALTTDQTAALSAWVNAIPAPPAPTWVDAAAAAAGRAIFERADVGCTACHNGTKMTNNATVDVGTGGAFQVPPLVGVGWRTPLLHDGCAGTIADRFAKCATTQHGNTSSLSPMDVTNLTAYLETL